MVVFYQKRGVALELQSFLQEIQDLSFHEKDVVEQQLLILQVSLLCSLLHSLI